jgi:hypothetical protein
MSLIVTTLLPVPTDTKTITRTLLNAELGGDRETVGISEGMKLVAEPALINRFVRTTAPESVLAESALKKGFRPGLYTEDLAMPDRSLP